MNYILLILICILPFSDLILHVRDIWISQGAVFQIGILTAFSYSLFKPSKTIITNLPLALLTLWLGLTTCYWWNLRINQLGIYDFLLFMPFFNFLIMVLFYKLITGYLKINDINRILKYFSYVIVTILFYCVLQYFNLDQFHKHFSDWKNVTDPVIGTIGNTTHLAGYLTLCLPVLYYNKNFLSTIGIILCWTVIIYTGSATGLVGGLLITLLYSILARIRGKADKYIWLGILISIILSIYIMGLDKILVFLNPEGRFEEWKKLYSIFAKYPITGTGLGKIFSLNGQWKHAHNEYYQLALECGIPALLIALYGIKDFFSKFLTIRKHEVSICLATIFIAFLFNSLLNFSAHLWLISSLAMFAYAGTYCIHGGNYVNTQTNKG